MAFVVLGRTDEKSRSRHRRIGRRWAGQMDVKKVGVVKGGKEGDRGRRRGRRWAG